jgi:putative peptidoglycan lipid II flippase
MARFTSATMISRVLGYVRDAAIAFAFGGEALTDTFYTAFRVSNLFRRLLGEGALGSSFIPVFSKALKTDSREEVQNFLNALFTTLTLILVLITAAGIVFAPQLTRLIAPGFESQPDKFEMTVLLTRWTFPFFLFICLAALSSGVLNSLKHFFVPAVAPAMLSVAEIGYVFAFLPAAALAFGRLSVEQQLVGLSVAAVVGGAGHWLVQLPQLFKEGFRLKFRWQPNHPHSKEVVSLMLPAMIGLSVDQIDAFLNTVMATFLADGAVTALYNSNRLMQLPLALFGIAAASVSLPAMADHTAEKEYGRFAETVNEALRMIVFMVLPAAVGLMALSHPIVELLFQHGKFSAAATSLTAQALVGYCAGLIAYSGVKVLANAFYALREPGTPVRVAAACVGLNVVMSLLLMGPLGVGGLALSTAIASSVNAVWLFIVLRSRLKIHGVLLETAGPCSLWTTFAKTGTACLGMGLALWAFLHASAEWSSVWKTLFGTIGGGLLFLALSRGLKIHERQSFQHLLDLRSVRRSAAKTSD